MRASELTDFSAEVWPEFVSMSGNTMDYWGASTCQEAEIDVWDLMTASER